MTLAQLDELLKLRSNLLNETAFVTAYVTKLQPGHGRRLEARPQVGAGIPGEAADVRRPARPGSQRAQSAHAYHRLVFDRAEGTYSKERFIDYLKLPRCQSYMAQAVARSDDRPPLPRESQRRFRRHHAAAPVNDDEPLVRSYLQHFLVDAVSHQGLRPVHQRRRTEAHVRGDEDRQRPGRSRAVGVDAPAGSAQGS